MTKKFSYIAAFDLDKTILTVNSSKLIVQASRKIGLMSMRDFLHAIYYSIVYKLDLKDANLIVSDMTMWLRGIKEAEVIELTNTHVMPVILELIRPEIIAEVEEHRRNNGCLLLLSSAIPYLCEPIARHLKMDDVISSKLETIDGVFTGKPERKLVFGREKAVRMKEYCEKHSYSLNSSWYYGDAFTDRFILQSVGNPVCVKPEFKLKRMAERKGWKII